MCGPFATVTTLSCDCECQRRLVPLEVGFLRTPCGVSTEKTRSSGAADLHRRAVHTEARCLRWLHPPPSDREGRLSQAEKHSAARRRHRLQRLQRQRNEGAARTEVSSESECLIGNPRPGVPCSSFLPLRPAARRDSCVSSPEPRAHAQWFLSK